MRLIGWAAATAAANMSRSKVSGFKIRPPKAGFGYVTNLDLKTLNAYSAEVFSDYGNKPDQSESCRNQTVETCMIHIEGKPMRDRLKSVAWSGFRQGDRQNRATFGVFINGDRTAMRVNDPF